MLSAFERRHQPDAEFGERVSKPHQPDHDIVKVHVTPLGGLYVHERELLRSKGAREMMAKMDRILREELVSQNAGHPQGGRQTQARER